MEDGNGNQPVERPNGEVHITWNPNTGELNLAAKNMNPMEELGTIELAAHIRRTSMSAPPAPTRVQLAGPLMPHLRH